jgi:hypothetical protein
LQFEHVGAAGEGDRVGLRAEARIGKPPEIVPLLMIVSPAPTMPAPSVPTPPAPPLPPVTVPVFVKAPLAVNCTPTPPSPPLPPASPPPVVAPPAPPAPPVVVLPLV